MIGGVMTPLIKGTEVILEPEMAQSLLISGKIKNLEPIPQPETLTAKAPLLLRKK